MSSLANLFRFDSPQRRREALCAHFLSLGINAQVTNRGRSEELLRAPGENSLGLITFQGGSLLWANLVQGMIRSSRSWDHLYSRTLGESYHRIWYGIRDPNLRVEGQSVQFHSTRRRSLPVFGKAVDVQWETETEEVQLGPLSTDATLKEPLLRTGVDVDVIGFPDGYWIISNRETGRLPNMLIWNAYQAVAQGLLQYSLKSSNRPN